MECDDAHSLHNPESFVSSPKPVIRGQPANRLAVVFPNGMKNIEDLAIRKGLP